ncbi:hypothetical protein HPP92_014893 [Vanilla planifolia]|uniref:Uncharacterized protein n=1 Tax=Vanilla planifolia TaxID=51239 RepID=A0A835UTL4_VANPL|nr:hypothetical protein HPP92_015369 [Vanilla planifolia]KAG0475207.1 hypothetical protein HPP92_014893 [Vanilla planifolia]
MAATPTREPTTPHPQPVIGKAGRYTVFITPPTTPRPPMENLPRQNPLTPSPRPCPGNVPPVDSKASAPSVPPVPPVQVPPPQFKKPLAKGSVFGFFWDAVAKIQNAHSSLDEFLANWLGLDQSKYQWALNDYYENTAMGKECSKGTELPIKGQIV